MDFSNNQMDGLIFVWGNYGKKLEKLDKKRLYSVVMDDSEFFLSSMYIEETKTVLDEVNKNGLSDKAKELIGILNDKEIIFKETNKFFKANQDNLSVGSLVTGNIDKSGRFADILKTKNIEGENNE